MHYERHHFVLQEPEEQDAVLSACLARNGTWDGDRFTIEDAEEDLFADMNINDDDVDGGDGKGGAQLFFFN